MKWTEDKPTQEGWYLWFREEYDILRRQFFHVGWHPDDKERNPDFLKVNPGNKSLAHIVGGLWYGPIPYPPLEQQTK